jgi:hypothetical protein
MSLEVLCKLKQTHGLRFFGDKLKKLKEKKIQAI